jgi:MFS family permease
MRPGRGWVGPNAARTHSVLSYNHTMNKKLLGLQKNVFFLGLTSFFNDFSSEMILSILPAFFISVLKSGAQALGIVEGIAEAASNVIKIYSGRWSDRIQRRKVFAIAGYTISVFSRPVYLLVSTVLGVIGLRVVDRIGKGLRDSPRDALISLSTPEEEVGRSFGYHRAMDTMGAITGPLVAFLILRAYPGGFNSIFVTAFVIGLVAIASLSLVKDVQKIIESKNTAEIPHVFSLRFKLYIVSIFVLSVGTLPVAVLLFKTQDLGIAIASIPLFYMIYNVSYALFSWPAGRAADSLGSGAVIFAGYIFLIFGYLVLILSSASWVLVAGFLLVGVFSALTDGVQRSYLSHLVEERYKGAAYGYLNATSGFGALVAGAGGGYLWQHSGDTFTLTVAIGVVIIGLVLFSADRALR